MQSKTTSKIYDKFRSSDDQIDFLMSEKGEMYLDGEIIKMMKDMNVDEIVQFTNQFFKFKQNQCSSLQTLITNQLTLRKDQSQEYEQFSHKMDDLQQIEKNKNHKDQERVSNINNINQLPHILTEMNKIKQALQQDLTSKTQKQQQNQDEDKIDFQKYTIEDYVPKLSNDDDYLTQNSHHQQQFMQFDKLPAYLLLQPEQIKKIDLEIIERKKILNQQQKIQTIKVNDQIVNNFQIKESSQIKQNFPQQNQMDAEEMDQNVQQVPYSVPTTVQQNQQSDFQEIQRISLPDNKFKITYNNGDQYEGQLQNQMKNGWGDYHYNTGQRYQGFFVDDEIHGYGQYFFLSGASYEGDWSSGMKHGMGILKFSNGDMYQGQFVKDHFHGKGTYNYANGDVFTGTWKNGQKHGKGKLQTFDGSLQMGNWVNDKFQI